MYAQQFLGSSVVISYKNTHITQLAWTRHAMVGPLWLLWHQVWHMAPDESSLWVQTNTANCYAYHVHLFFITVAYWMSYSCWDLALNDIWPIQIWGGASDVMHHATAAVLWLQCAIVFILCCVHVWVNLMNCGHHNSNLGLSPGCNERQVAAGWAFHVAQGHGPGWELEFWCQCVLRIAACMWWNFSTLNLQTKSYKLWHSSEVWATCGNW